ncbi:DUF6547 family protein [Microbulbifer yueqingensis]|uniref:Uncharacterized protein n=1 Tax=Microbulbifer yueqingensis TaxID=658219 RepID=A0A1G8Y4N6_9GAMM|nr:DUF6547 family protein [Microbulbifer yueqingensis]SDJ97751.1 hypothetical protein SAMN05216212_1357 [Microbulbifer yueqingensis]
MTKEVEAYKKFIDEVVSIKDAATSKWVARGSYPETKENQYRNEVLSSLSEAQREEVANIVQEAKESGVHDLLALLNQECSLAYQGIALPSEPFGTELNYDFVARLEADKWPR